MAVIAISIVIMVASIAIAVAVLVRLPSDYLQHNRATACPKPGGDTRFALRAIVRNVLGASLVVVGLLLAIPGVPGQGLIVALAGVLLLDFPAKRNVLSYLLGRPRLLHTINRLRRWFSRPPLGNG